MIIVDAVWEKRNLGLDVVEIQIDPKSSLIELEKIKDLVDCNYISVKVPVARPELLSFLNEQGFKFVEMLTKVAVAELPQLTGMRARLAKGFSDRKVNRCDRREIKNQILNGMFSTDRFSLDRQFSAEQAAKRYLGWIQDVEDNGGDLRALVHKNICVGFFIVTQKKNGIYDSVLAGLFPNLAPLGSGFIINHQAYLYCFERGAKQVHTTYSSNNYGAAGIHSELSTRLISQEYVYVKHNVVKGAKSYEQ